MAGANRRNSVAAATVLAIGLGTVPSVALSPTGLKAQSPDAAPAGFLPRLAPGTRVRVQPGDGPPITGHVVAVRSDTMVVDVDGEYGEVRIPLARLERLEIGHRQSGAGRVALRGLIVGAGIGGGLALIGCASEGGECGFAITLALVYGGIGAGIGALVGAMFGSETWVPVPLEGVSAAPLVIRGAIGLSVSVPVR